MTEKELKELQLEIKGTLNRHPQVTGIGLYDTFIKIRVLSHVGKEEITKILAVGYPDSPIEVEVSKPIVAC